MDEIPERPGLAVRAQVGRLPLPRLPRRRPDRAAVEERPAAGPLLPGGGRAPARAARPLLRPRRRDRHPAGRPPVLRRSPPADPPGREPDRAALAGAPRGAHRLRPAGGRGGQGARRSPAPGAPAAPGGLRGQGARRSRRRPALPRHRGRGPGARLARHGGRHARRHRGQAARPALPDRRADRHAEGEAPPHGGLRGGRLPLRIGLAGGGLAPPRPLRRGRAAPSRRLHVRLPGRRPHDAPGQARAPDQAARVHGPRAGRAQPLEHRALGGMGAARAQAGRRGELRPLHGRPLPSRHPLPALAARQGAAPVHPRPGRAQ